jgi:hypothetical protein
MVSESVQKMSRERLKEINKKRMTPAILDLLLSEVILRDLALDPISYVFVYSKSLRPTYFRALK